MQRLLLLALAAALNVRAYTVSSKKDAALPDASQIHDFDYDSYSGYAFPYDFDLPLKNGTVGTDTYTYAPAPTRSSWDVYMYSSLVQTLEHDDAKLHGIVMQMRALARSYVDILYYKYLHVPPPTSAG